MLGLKYTPTKLEGQKKKRKLLIDVSQGLKENQKLLQHNKSEIHTKLGKGQVT